MNQNSLGGLCAASTLQIGWRDSDGDHIHDILDTNPETTLAPFSPDPTAQTVLGYTGTATVVPLTNQNPEGFGNDITLQTLIRVEFRVDSGAWSQAIPDDGAFDETIESFRFNTPSLAPGPHTVEARAVSSCRQPGSHAGFGYGDRDGGDIHTDRHESRRRNRHGDQLSGGHQLRHGLLRALCLRDLRDLDRHSCRWLDLQRLERRLHGHRHVYRLVERGTERHRDVLDDSLHPHGHESRRRNRHGDQLSGGYQLRHGLLRALCLRDLRDLCSKIKVGRDICAMYPANLTRAGCGECFGPTNHSSFPSCRRPGVQLVRAERAAIQLGRAMRAAGDAHAGRHDRTA